MYTISITKRAKKDLRKLPVDIARRIIAKLKKVAPNPYASNKNITALSGSDAYRLCVGAYRAVYYLHDGRLVLELVKVRHRKEVYRGTT